MTIPARSGPSLPGPVAALLVCLVTGWGLIAGWGAASGASSDLGANDPRMERLAGGLPALERKGFATSKQCIDCHPKEHASWDRSYHSSMTQVALPENMLSDFEEAEVESAGLKYRVFRRGDTFWAEMPDPEVMLDVARGKPGVKLSEIPRVERQITMATGSHHYQTYWVPSTRFDTVMQTLPLVYLPKDRRWIPREAAFMNPPDQPFRMITIWNDHCIGCHSTGGSPGLKGPKELSTSVGELGIACEACHGAGEAHVAKHMSTEVQGLPPVARSTEPDPTIVNPARLDHRRSSQVCGQCHGVFIRDEHFGMKYAREGDSYRPGDDLHQGRIYIEYPQQGSPKEVWGQFAANRDFYRERWWEDGTMLAGGREYTALMSNPCFQRGEMSCLSCHAMHDSPPDRQVTAGMETSAACTQCHSEPRFNAGIASHTHHAAGSSGSECMNCHMPHTSYALFRAIRNHSISSPTVAQSVQKRTPNACNLCHLDRTLAWTQQNLTDWYGHEPVPLDEDQKSVAASVLWLLKGDAAQRAVTAWHFGWAPALEASGADWGAPVLAPLLLDPYGVVRYVAQTSLGALLPGELQGYDFLAEQAELQAAMKGVVAAWRKGRHDPHGMNRATLVTETGEPDWRAMKRLLSQRDNRPVQIKE